MARTTVVSLASQGRKKSGVSQKKKEASTKKTRNVTSSNLMVCFDLEMADGPIASEIFQVTNYFYRPKI